MANLPESQTYDAGIYQLETTDPVAGGVNGITNAPLKSLANRTAYLKAHVDAIEAGTTIPPTVAPLNSPPFTGTPTVPDVALGDSSGKAVNSRFVQQTVGGILNKSVAGGANVTLTSVEAGYGILNLTGALTANIAVIVPASSDHWVVLNNTTGGFTLTVKTAAGSGVAVAQGYGKHVVCDGTNVLQVNNDTTNMALLGKPTAPAPAVNDNTSQIPTTSWTNTAITNATGPLAPKANPTFTGTVTLPANGATDYGANAATTQFATDQANNLSIINALIFGG